MPIIACHYGDECRFLPELLEIRRTSPFKAGCLRTCKIRFYCWMHLTSSSVVPVLLATELQWGQAREWSRRIYTAPCHYKPKQVSLSHPVPVWTCRVVFISADGRTILSLLSTTYVILLHPPRWIFSGLMLPLPLHILLLSAHKPQFIKRKIYVTNWHPYSNIRM